MLEDALSYPTKGESGISRNIIGGTLVLFSFLIIPAFFVGGYMIRTLASAARGEEEPPEFNDWGGLFKDGLKGAVVGIAYGLVPMIIMGVMFAMLIGGSNSSSDSAGLLSGIGIIGLLVSFVLALVVQYVVPAAVTNLGRTGNIGAAFDFDTLGPVLTSKEYLVAVGLTVLIAIAGGMVFSIFAAITFGLGYLVAPFFYFWLYLAGSYMFGTAFGKVVGDYRDQSSEPTATPMN